MTDVKQVVPSKSSPPMKNTKSSKPSLKVLPVHESDAAYFTVKTHKGESKENSPVTSVHISPIKLKYSILNKERLKRSYQASDFLHDIEIPPSRSELKKHKVKRSITILCFLKYISNDLGSMIYLEIIPSAPTKLMYH